MSLLLLLGRSGPDIQVAQAWFGIPEPAATADLSASQTVGGFTQAATGEVYVTGTAAQSVGAFSHSATLERGPWVEVAQAWLQAPQGPISAQAAQTVGDFGAQATGEGEQPAAETPTRKTGGGAPGRTRRVVVRIDDDEFIVDSAQAAQALIAQAQAAAEETARAKAAELAAREKVRYRAARRAAPVIRIEAPEVPEIAAVQAQVEDVNARLREMYESALRTALIRRELQRRMDEDEEDALAALLI